MKENKLVKYQSGQLQKVGNQIAVTNKLLRNDFDYLKWWDELEIAWKQIFQAQLKFQLALVSLKHKLKKTGMTQQESSAFEFIKSKDEADYSMNVPTIKCLVEIPRKVTTLFRLNVTT